MAVTAQQLQSAIDRAKQDPNSEFATELRRRMESGSLDAQIKELGLNVPKPKGTLERVVEFGPQASIGAAKGLLSTGTSGSGLLARTGEAIGKFAGEKIVTPTLHALGLEGTEKSRAAGQRAQDVLAPESGKRGAEQFVPERAITPTNTAQKIGFGAEQIGELVAPQTFIGKVTKIPSLVNKGKRSLDFVQKAITGAARSGTATEQAAIQERGEFATATELRDYGAIDLALAGAGSLVRRVISGRAGKEVVEELTPKGRKVADALDDNFFQESVDEVKARAKFGNKTPGEIVVEAAKDDPSRIPTGSTDFEIVESIMKQGDGILDRTGDAIAQTIKNAPGGPSYDPIDKALKEFMAPLTDPKKIAAAQNVIDSVWQPIKESLGPNPSWEQIWMAARNLEKELSPKVLGTGVDVLGSPSAIDKAMKKEITSNIRGSIRDGVPDAVVDLDAYGVLVDKVDDVANRVKKGTGVTESARKFREKITETKEKLFRAILPESLERKLLPTDAQRLEKMVTELAGEGNESAVRKIINAIPSLKGKEDVVQSILKGITRQFNQ